MRGGVCLEYALHKRITYLKKRNIKAVLFQKNRKKNTAILYIYAKMESIFHRRAAECIKVRGGNQVCNATSRLMPTHKKVNCVSQDNRLRSFSITLCKQGTMQTDSFCCIHPAMCPFLTF